MRSEPRTPPVCDDAVLHQTPGLAKFTFLGKDCTSEFQEVGMPGTDALAIARWDGQKWESVVPDGRTEGTGMEVPCWEPGKLRSMGVPEAIVKKKAECSVH